MNNNGEKMNESGKAWRTFALTGIPVAGLIVGLLTWAYFGGVVKGEVINRMSQAERRISKLERIYEQTAKDITDIRIMLAGMQLK